MSLLREPPRRYDSRPWAAHLYLTDQLQSRLQVLQRIRQLGTRSSQRGSQALSRQDPRAYLGGEAAGVLRNDLIRLRREPTRLAGRAAVGG